jgi:hypothetical protein
MIATLRAAGVRNFGYYAMPELSASELGYTRAFSARHRPCIAPDAQLVADLRDWTDWYDATHLLGESRRRVTIWLAERLAEQFAHGPAALADAPATRGAPLTPSRPAIA